MGVKLVLLYLSLLKSDNYKEQIDSTSFYRLLGLDSDATRQQVEVGYRLLKERMKPGTYPELSANKERFEYLISRIDRGYNDYISGKTGLDDVGESFNHNLISETESYSPAPYIHHKPSSQPLISEMEPEEYSPAPYISYKDSRPDDFISQGSSNNSGDRSLVALESADVFTMGDSIKNDYVSIPVDKLGDVSNRIIDAIVGKILNRVSLSDPEMIATISTVLKDYSSKKEKFVGEVKK